MLVALFATAFGAVLDWRRTLAVVGLILVMPFAGATALRILAAIEVLRRPATGPSRARLPSPRAPGPLPTYAVLVPLYDETEVLASLVAHLSALDYPPDRLEIMIVLEAHDRSTRQALAGIRLPAHIRAVVVPPGGPRTKPKALNYALTEVASDFVVVFDAEDRPEPDQLRMAVAAFRRGPRDLACLQARLNVYNSRSGFFPRQFALEYTALFDGLLPALERLGAPIPLGGTSNHFRTRHLKAAGGWDPYNVTEDADLGIRLARMNLRTATLSSTTWEEAPTTRRVWLGQRRRWIKGWMQTWLVHMRHPLRLLDELGLWRFAAIQVVMGGVVLSALVYPLFLALAAGLYAVGELHGPPDGAIAAWAWWLALANCVTGLAAPMLLALVAVVRRGRADLAFQVLLMPGYWLMVSFAGYRALVELLHRPFHWEKTRHGALPSRLGGYNKRRARTAAARVPSSR